LKEPESGLLRSGAVVREAGSVGNVAREYLLAYLVRFFAKAILRTLRLDDVEA
jgi:hypothetical protein